MGLLSYPFKAYVRWRHSRGFGVHSPFAYTLVRMAIRPGQYGYYGYEDIDEVVFSPAYKGYPHSRHDARLLLRVLVQLRSRRLILPEGLPAMCAAARGAGIPHHCYGSLPAALPGDFIVSTPGSISDTELYTRIKEGTPVLMLHPAPSAVEAAYKGCERGVSFSGTRLLLVIPRREMAFVDYTMKF